MAGEAVKGVARREIAQGMGTYYVRANAEGRVGLGICPRRAVVASAAAIGNGRAPLGGDLEDVPPIAFLRRGVGGGQVMPLTAAATAVDAADTTLRSEP